LKKSPKVKTNAARILDDLGVAYELMSYEADEDDLSADRAALDIGMPSERVYKTLVLRGDRTGILEACIPAGMELDLKALASVSGNKSVEMVHVKELPGLTGYIRGGCSPIGGKKRYPVYVYERILEHESIAVNAGQRGLLFKMSPGDLIAAARAETGNIARGRV
jgi:Cys-tRNA(Pro)/Cys-tRNA(Cys) deacylase